MIVVASSDWHADWTTSGVSRYEEVRRAALHSVEVAREAKADLYLFPGDLCDPDDALSVLRSVALLTEVVVKLNALNIPSILLPGNHDVGEDGTGVTTLHPLASLTACCFQPSFRVVGEDVALFALPFTATAHAYDAAVEVAMYAKVARHGTTIFLSHLSVKGIQPGEEVADMPRGREVTLPLAEIAKVPGKVLVIQGHYHRAQTFEDPTTGVKVHVVGSLVRLTHSEEAHEPSVLVLEV